VLLLAFAITVSILPNKPQPASKSDIPIKGMGSSVCLISRVNLQDFYVPVGVILPVLDGKSSANMDVNRPTGVIRLAIIGMLARLSPNCDESVS
jgi:hypothetical protein